MIFIFPAKERFLLFVVFILWRAILCAQSGDIFVPQFQGPLQTESNAGQIKVVWSLADSLIQSRLFNFELQQSRDSLFSNPRTLYKGSDLASFVSGLPNGDYYFRVRTILDDNIPGVWSKTLSLRVRHQSLVLAFTLFGLGAVVFVSTVLLIFTGNRKAKRENETS